MKEAGSMSPGNIPYRFERSRMVLLFLISSSLVSFTCALIEYTQNLSCRSSDERDKF